MLRLLITAVVLSTVFGGPAHAATIYVNWVTGSDNEVAPDPIHDGTFSLPWKTITQALSKAASGDTIVVVGGSQAIHEYLPGGGGESFPLSADKANITIQGTRTPRPTIKCDSFQFQSWPAGQKAAIRVDSQSGWTIEHLTIDNSNYQTHNTFANNFVYGIAVRKLPQGGDITIKDCELIESFSGLYFYDEGAPFAATRTINVEDTLIKGHGPVFGDASATVQGHAGLRLLEAQNSTMKLNVTDCTFEDNHDALECGAAETTVVDTMFEGNETGVEIASVSGADIFVTGCCFRLNQVYDPSDGGSVAQSTGGIIFRGATDVVKLKVRGTDFDRNQIGALLRDGTVATGGVIDLGTSYGAPGRGGNTFTTDTTSPWYQFRNYNASHCGLFTGMETEVKAVGNTWTYQLPPFPDPDWYQGCDTNGEFPAGPKKLVPAGTNLEPPPNDTFPPHRAHFGTTNPQVPWNYSTANKIGTTDFPSILLVP